MMNQEAEKPQNQKSTKDTKKNYIREKIKQKKSQTTQHGKIVYNHILERAGKNDSNKMVVSKEQLM